jgi:polysaccharide export outer membrane protein
MTTQSRSTSAHAKCVSSGLTGPHTGSKKPLLAICGGVLTGMSALLVLPVASAQESTPAAPEQSRPKCDNQVRSTYLLGTDDQLEISEPELPELTNKQARIDGDGDIQVVLAGRVHVSGLTVQQVEQALDNALKIYIRRPQVAVSVSEIRSQPVSVLGEVNTPGVHQVQGFKTLLEMLALAGGTRPDAGYHIRITRQMEWGCIPLPNAEIDASGRFSVAEVNLKQILDAQNPKDNIQIFPHDTISVPKAELVYVIGDVKRAGGFALGEQKTISVLHAISLAEGLNGTADAHHARILRLNRNSDRREEISVDLKGVLSGKSSDVALQGDDILFIPGSTGKKAALRGIEAALQVGTGLAIWRVP